MTEPIFVMKDGAFAVMEIESEIREIILDEFNEKDIPTTLAVSVVSEQYQANRTISLLEELRDQRLARAESTYKIQEVIDSLIDKYGLY